MSLNLKPFEQRFAAVGLAIASLLLGYLLLLHWWFTAPLLVINQEARMLRQTYQQYHMQLAQRVPLEEQLAVIHAQDAAAQTLLSGADSGAAGAELMGLLAKYVQGSAGNGQPCSISNRVPVTGSTEKGFSAVKINVNLDCEAAPLARLLHQIENSHPTLIIESMSIRRLDASTATGHHQLSVQLLIAGYLHNAL